MPTRSLPTRHGHACFVWRLCGPWHVKAPQAARSPGRNKKNSTSAPAALTIHTAVAYETTPPTYTRKSGSKLPPLRLGCSCSSDTLCPDRRPWADTVHVQTLSGLQAYGLRHVVSRERAWAPYEASHPLPSHKKTARSEDARRLLKRLRRWLGGARVIRARICRRYSPLP